jgi:beta-galactosidase
VDRQSIRADRRDVVHITAAVTDEAGRLAPDADSEITFTVEGDGLLLALDSGDPASHEDFRAPRRKAFHGLCLALVRSAARAGQIRVAASAAGLQPASVTVRTV